MADTKPAVANPPETKPPETKALSPVERLRDLMETEKIKRRFDDVLKGDAPLFKSSLVSAVSMNEGLREADPMSIISAAFIAASLKLPINSSLGWAHIVPYKGVAAFQMGWKGFVQLAQRTGQYKTMNATVVYEGQLKTINSFTGEYEFQEERKSDAIIGYLFYFKLVNGFEKYVYWTKEKCEAHAKRYSATYRKGYGKWVDDFDNMALKTVVKMGLSKFGPLSVELQTAVEQDESSGGQYPDSVSAETVPTEPGDVTSPTRLKNIIEGESVPATSAKEIEFGSGPKRDIPL